MEKKNKKDIKTVPIVVSAVLIIVAIMGLSIFQAQSLKEMKAKKYCGNNEVQGMVREISVNILKKEIGLTTFFSGKAAKEQYKKAIEDYKKNTWYSDFKILNHDKNYKHFYCQAAAHFTDIHGLPKESIVKYYVKYYKKNGKEWVHVNVPSL